MLFRPAGFGSNPAVHTLVPGEGDIPLSADDSRFANCVPYSGGNTLGEGQSLTDKTFEDTSGNPCIYLAGDNTFTRVRVTGGTREGPRIAGSGYFTFNDCWIETYGQSGDHADCLQFYAPGNSGSLNLTNCTLRAYTDAESPSGVGSAGIMLGDGFAPVTITFRSVLVWGGYIGLHLFPDTGGDCYLDFEDVYFVGPFGTAIDSGSWGGHDVVVTNWTNVKNATIVGGVIVPGSDFPQP